MLALAQHLRASAFDEAPASSGTLNGDALRLDRRRRLAARAGARGRAERPLHLAAVRRAGRDHARSARRPARPGLGAGAPDASPTAANRSRWCRPAIPARRRRPTPRCAWRARPSGASWAASSTRASASACSRAAAPSSACWKHARSGSGRLSDGQHEQRARPPAAGVARSADRRCALRHAREPTRRG